MKVFISWSGERSKALAIALKEWLPLVLQYTKPWVSEKDISAGERWAQKIAGELESSNFGILCITPENISSEWILFEAGALSKSMLDAKVIPLLFGLELSDLSGPLSQFQALKVDQQGLLDVAKAINAVAESRAAESTINQLVPALWSQLQRKLDEIPDKEVTDKHMRPQTEVLEDLVSQVRGLGARMRDFDPEMLERDPRYWNAKHRRLNSRMINALAHSLIDSRESGMSLVLLAGLLRDQIPWLAELLIETHRDLKNANPDEAIEVRNRLMLVITNTTHGPLGDWLIGRDKSTYILMKELPMIIDRVIDRAISFKMQPQHIADETELEEIEDDAE